MQDEITSWVIRYRKNSWSFFNTGTKEKKVFTPWTRYQSSPASDEEIKRWLSLTSQNWAIVCGEISNLVVFDVDTKNGGDPTPFLNKNLYEIRTPSGGYHFYTLYNPLLKSTRHKKDPKSGILKAVDVQSNGSIVFAPPSQFINGAYVLTNDVPITALPDDLLAQVLEELEPEKEAQEYTPFIPRKNAETGGRPGDIFNVLATWEDVLLPHGWQKVGRPSATAIQFWRRPGKKDGISASTNWKGYDLFFPYTTSTDLLPKKGYTRFHLYAVLNHSGDFQKAARALVVENYRIAHKLV